MGATVESSAQSNREGCEGAMGSKASISRISEATREKIRELYVRHGVAKYALAQRFHIYAADVTRITKGLKSVEASREVQALGLGNKKVPAKYSYRSTMRWFHRGNRICVP